MDDCDSPKQYQSRHDRRHASEDAKYPTTLDNEPHLQEGLSAGWVGCVQHSAVQEHHAHVLEGVVCLHMRHNNFSHRMQEVAQLSMLCTGPEPMRSNDIGHSVWSWGSVLIYACTVVCRQRMGDISAAHVLADAAAHAGGVVGDHAADHAGVDRGGVGANLVLDVMLALGLVPSQQRINLPANQSWLNSDAAAITLQIRNISSPGHEHVAH